jgi:hypothetical protein
MTLAVWRSISKVTAMAIRRKRVDRAQRFRARRVWWERHGPFAKGALTGSIATLMVIWLVRLMITL